MVAAFFRITTPQILVLAYLVIVFAAACPGCENPGQGDEDKDVPTAPPDISDGGALGAGKGDADAKDAANSAKPYCNGSWMCSGGTCKRVLDSQPAVGKHIGRLRLLHDADGAARGILAATFYNQVPGGSLGDEWDLVTTEVALMELRPDGEFRYVSEAFPFGTNGFPARTATGALALATMASLTTEPTDPHLLGHEDAGPMLVVSKVNSDKSLLNLAALGEWYPVYFRGGSEGSTVDLVVEPLRPKGSPESALGPRVYVIDIETGVTILEKALLGGTLVSNQPHGSLVPAKGRPAWGIANLNGQRVLHQWVWVSEKQVAFSLSKLDDKFNIVSTSPVVLGAATDDAGFNFGPAVAASGDKLYIIAMFGEESGIAAVTIEGVVESVAVPWLGNSFPGIAVLPSSTGGKVISANGRQVFGIEANGAIKWSNIFGDWGLGGPPDPFRGKRNWPLWYVNDGEVKRIGLDFSDPRPRMITFGNGRHVHIYQTSDNPIWNPSPSEPGNPPRAGNIAPYYLFYFDDNGKLLCN